MLYIRVKNTIRLILCDALLMLKTDLSHYELKFRGLVLKENELRKDLTLVADEADNLIQANR